MANRIQIRRDTAANWTSVNPILAQGELGIELVTNKLKVGNGITAWNSLSYFTLNYSDVTGAPTALSDLTNDAGYITAADLPANELPVNAIGYLFNDGTGTLSWDSVVGPTAVSQLDNDTGFITAADLPANELPVNAAGYLQNDGSGTLTWGSPTGNIEFRNDSINDLNGITITNADQTTPATSFISIPANGVGNVTIENNGNIWSFESSALTQFPAIAGESLFIQGPEIGSENASIAISAKDNVLITADILGTPKQWQFSTDGSLTVPGDILPDGDNTRSLGSPTRQWKELYVSNGSIYIGNVKLSNSNGTLQINTVERVVDPDTQEEVEVTLNGTFGVSNTRKGWINLVGDKPNEYDEAWFEAVTINGNYAYVAGGDYYTNSDDLTKIYKFNLDTGDQVWVKEIVAGRGALFDFAIASEVITIAAIANAGTGYLAGEELHFPGYYWSGGNTSINRITVVVDTVDLGTGAILAASIKPGYNLAGIGDQLPSGLQAENDNARGISNSIAYDLNLEKLIVVSQYRTGLGDQNFDNYYYWTNVYVVDPVTGIVDQTATLSTEGDVNANSIKVKNTPGGFVIVGEKFGEFRQFGTLALLQGYNGYFDVLKSEFDLEHYPGGPYEYFGDYWVSGTGISSYNNVDGVNEYPTVTGTVRQGSGASFTLSDASPAPGYTLMAIPTGGTFYLPGHKIKILGSDLGGTDGVNDAIITVTEVSGTSITGATVDGVAFATAPVEGWTVTGTNYQTGSGVQFNINVTPADGLININYISAAGSNYVTGDVIIVDGTTWAGGQSPANNVTLVVGSVDVSGGVTNWNNEGSGGTAPTTALRIRVDGVDFTAVGGSWSMKQNLGGEAFVWTPQWSNAIGGPSGDRFYDVCYSQDGNSIFAVGRGRYETIYNQALFVKFDASTGAVVWGKDIKFTEAGTENREARAICLVPGSSDLIIVGAWYNPTHGNDGFIITRVTEAGVAVWQKTYDFYQDGGQTLGIDYEVSAKAFKGNILISAEMSTPIHSRGLGYLVIDPDGTIVTSRVLSADGNSNYNYYETPTPQFADAYTDVAGKDYVVMAGHTYVPTDYYYNALLIKLPLDGYKDLQPGEWVSIGEHILSRYWWTVTTVTPAFDSFTATEHLNTITTEFDQRNYNAITPTGLLNVWNYKITDDSAGFLEFGDGSKQSFATNLIPQIPAANNYYLTEQDSGKHIFFENENGRVYIPHWQVKNLPVGFTLTIINTTGNDCYIECQDNPAGDGIQGQLKLAGRNIQTSQIGIPDSGSGSMVTLVKVKSGYSMLNTDPDTVYPDIWMVSGPGDIYDSL